MGPAFACTRAVNPAGVEPRLTEQQLWKGLKDKARDPRPYVPAIKESRVTHEEGNKLTRMVRFNDGAEEEREDVEFVENAVVYFSSPEIPNRVINTISYGAENELLLTYTFATPIPGFEDDEHQLSSIEKNEVVGKIIDHSIEAVRKMVREGKLH
ncbi:hypothetical protein JCM10212_001211 [Sporobolomyces blumeae]